MNNIKRIEEFLESYQNLASPLKEICKGSYDYYQNELLKEYVRIGKHPYPQEYLTNQHP